MGIPGILKEIGKGERTALSKLAIEHFERHNRPLRIAIDAAIWNFQTLSGQGGKNPALRTLFFRLLRLLALPIQPVFVYDGKNKPLTKRGRTVSRYHGTCVPNELSKGLVKRFCYSWHVAPGEAEAECAFLQKRGVVDMVMSQDADAIMFGAGVTLRDWSKEGTKGNKAPTHVNVMDIVRLKEISGLDCEGMILVAMLSGGDYNENGLPGFGAMLSCEIARAGFGKDLIDLVRQEDWSGLREWRERLSYELETNESGHFKRRHKTLKVPDTFPDLQILSYYTTPAVSNDADLSKYESEWNKVWTSEIDVPALREYTSTMFDWCWKSGARRFVRCFAQPLFQDRLRRGMVSTAMYTTNSISERRKHFINDGISELRFSAVPADVVAIDIEAEEENPEHVQERVEDDADEAAVTIDAEDTAAKDDSEGIALASTSSSTQRKSPPWSPYVAEKWWIPETLLQLGLPEIVENWHQLQRDIQSDPKKFATRRAVKLGNQSKRIDTTMKSGAIREYFTNVGKPNQPNVQASPHTTADLVVANMLTDDKVAFSAQQNTTQRVDTRRSVERQNAHISDTTGSEPGRSIATGKDTYLPSSQLSSISNTTTSYAIPSSSPSLPAITRTSSLHQTSSSRSQVNPEKSSQREVGHSRSTKLKLSHNLSSPITQRKPRHARNKAQSVHNTSAESPTRAGRPIESFFPVRGDGCSTKAIDEEGDHLAVGTKTLEPLESPRRVTCSLKNTAAARDSLPGTWKELSSNGTPRRGGSRVSFIDLTAD